MYKLVRARSILTPFSVHVQDAYALSAARCHFLAANQKPLTTVFDVTRLARLRSLGAKVGITAMRFYAK